MVDVMRILAMVLAGAAMIVAAACDPKKPPMTPDNDLMGDAGIDIAELGSAPDAGSR